MKSCRLDKFVWSVRLAKTRSQSADAISNGKVRLNDDHAKPAKEVKLGDEIQIIRNSAKFTFKVIQLLHNRVGAKLVQDYIIDITPEEEKEAHQLLIQPHQCQVLDQAHQAGRQPRHRDGLVRGR